MLARLAGRVIVPRGVLGIIVLLVAFTLLAILYSVSVPLFEGPDEDDHFRYVKFLADNRALPVQLFQSGGGAAGHQGWQPPLYYGLAALVISPIDTSDFEQHLWRNPAASYQGDRSCCGRNLYFHTTSEDFPYAATTLAVHLARGVSIFFGVVTVALIYLLALELFPAQVWLALAAAALAAFNPSFLFASALVSNDAPLAAFCTLTLLLLVRLLKGTSAPTVRVFTVVGLAIALGLMVKTTALGLIPFAFAVAAFVAWEKRQWAVLLKASLGILLPVLVLAGWWFIRNQLLYGDPLAYRLMSVSAIFPRDQPLTLAELFGISLPWLWQTFWGGPTPGDFPVALSWLFVVLTVLASIGVVMYFFRTREVSGRAILILLVGWLGFIFFAQVQFMRTSGGTDQGRYLFPALASFAVFGVAGLRELLARPPSRDPFPRLAGEGKNVSFPHLQQAGGRGRGMGAALAAISLLAFALGVSVLVMNTIPAYARPPARDETVLVEAQSLVNANFSNQLALRGYAVSSHTVRPGEKLNVTLYWTGVSPMRESFRVFAHLVDDKGRVAGGKDVIPAGGAFPTVLWRPGEWVADTIPIVVNRDAFPGSYSIEVGVYPFGQPDNRLNLFNSDEDRVLLDAIEVAR